MHPTEISPCINVYDLEPAREFYTTHFDGHIFFDCGWYVNIEFGKGGPSLQFMQPQSPDQPVYQGGSAYNLKLESTDLVDEMHARLTKAELPMVMPLEDHPWGDRGFCTLDPYGLAIYVYADIEPSEDFKQYYI